MILTKKEGDNNIRNPSRATRDGWYQGKTQADVDGSACRSGSFFLPFTSEETDENRANQLTFAPGRDLAGIRSLFQLQLPILFNFWSRAPLIRSPDKMLNAIQSLDRTRTWGGLGGFAPDFLVVAFLAGFSFAAGGKKEERRGGRRGNGREKRSTESK